MYFSLEKSLREAIKKNYEILDIVQNSETKDPEAKEIGDSQDVEKADEI